MSSWQAKMQRELRQVSSLVMVEVSLVFTNSLEYNRIFSLTSILLLEVRSARVAATECSRILHWAAISIVGCICHPQWMSTVSNMCRESKLIIQKQLPITTVFSHEMFWKIKYQQQVSTKYYIFKGRIARDLGLSGISGSRFQRVEVRTIPIFIRCEYIKLGEKKTKVNKVSLLHIVTLQPSIAWSTSIAETLSCTIEHSLSSIPGRDLFNEIIGPSSRLHSIPDRKRISVFSFVSEGCRMVGQHCQ